jgi:hypothetical protein
MAIRLTHLLGHLESHSSTRSREWLVSSINCLLRNSGLPQGDETRVIARAIRRAEDDLGEAFVEKYRETDFHVAVFAVGKGWITRLESLRYFARFSCLFAPASAEAKYRKFAVQSGFSPLAARPHLMASSNWPTA